MPVFVLLVRSCKTIVRGDFLFDFYELNALRDHGSFTVT